MGVGYGEEERTSMERSATLDKVLVVIPTYNEAGNIESIVERLRSANPQVHVLIADDNSPDGTGQIADRLAADDQCVHVLHRRGKEGLAAAYLAGFGWGLERDYDVLVEHDADGSHQPEELHLLLEALQDADMVKGSRYVQGGKTVNWPRSRWLLSRLGNIWVNFWLPVRVSDATGGFNAFRATALRDIDLSGVQAAGYAFQVDMTWRVKQAGLVVSEVPITFVEREIGASKMSNKIVIEAMFLVARWGLKYRGSQLLRVAGKAEPVVQDAVSAVRRKMTR